MGPVGYAFTDNDRSEFNRIKRKIDSVRGPGVTNTPDNISINPPQATPRKLSASDDSGLGQYQGMVETMVSQLQSGWAFCQAVSM